MAHKSTIVRAVRLIARILTPLAPSLAARWLERLFLTPTRWPVPSREIAWLAGATSEKVRFDDARELAIYRWGSGPPVLLVHGWSGRGSQLGAFVEPLVERGFSVVAFDAPGHGAADGRLTGLPEMAAALERVAESVGPVHAIVAHSLGTAATTIALSRGLKVDRLVYVSPPANPGDFLYRAARYLGFGDATARRTRRRIERRFDFSFLEARGTLLARSLDTPLLTLHDEHDQDVPIAEGRFLVDSWTGARLVKTSGLGHRRILRDPAVIEAAVRFLSASPATSASRRASPDHALHAV